MVVPVLGVPAYGFLLEGMFPVEQARGAFHQRPPELRDFRRQFVFILIREERQEESIQKFNVRVLQDRPEAPELFIHQVLPVRKPEDHFQEQIIDADPDFCRQSQRGTVAVRVFIGRRQQFSDVLVSQVVFQAGYLAPGRLLLGTRGREEGGDQEPPSILGTQAGEQLESRVFRPESPASIWTSSDSPGSSPSAASMQFRSELPRFSNRSRHAVSPSTKGESRRRSCHRHRRREGAAPAVGTASFPQAARTEAPARNSLVNGESPVPAISRHTGRRHPAGCR